MALAVAGAGAEPAAPTTSTASTTAVVGFSRFVSMMDTALRTRPGVPEYGLTSVLNEFAVAAERMASEALEQLLEAVPAATPGAVGAYPLVASHLPPESSGVAVQRCVVCARVCVCVCECGCMCVRARVSVPVCEHLWSGACVYVYLHACAYFYGHCTRGCQPIRHMGALTHLVGQLTRGAEWVPASNGFEQPMPACFGFVSPN